MDMENVNFKFVVKAAFGFLAVLLALSLVLSSFYTVDQGEMAVVTRFGAVVDVTGPGLHGKLPWVTSTVAISTRTWSQTWEKTVVEGKVYSNEMPSYSHDQQSANISAKITFRVKADHESIKNLYTTYRNTEAILERVVVPRTMQAIKTTFGQYTAAGVIQNRAKFNVDVDSAVRSAIDNGLEGKAGLVAVEAVTIQNIDFSDAYEHAVEQRMQAEVEVAKVAQNLERERKTAEIVVVQAQAQANSQLALAKASAEATRIKGDAEASAIRARAAALQSNPFLVQLTLAEKWNGILPTTMVPGSAVPFLNVK
jgi:regulator of protease activity HflC (stomatin/prohibitin superfamily)